MKNERILNALSRADDKYVEEAMPTAAPTKESKDNAFEAEGLQAEPVAVTAPKRKVYGSRIAAAACACVAVGGLVVWGAVGGVGNLSENPTTAETGEMGEEYAETGSPELNGYHNFMLTQEQLYDSVWSCFLPEYFPAGYSLAHDVQCVQANGLAPANYEAEIFLWLSNGIEDPDMVGYAPIGFSLVVDNHIDYYGDPDYDLQTLTVSDVAEMGVGTIDCGHNVMIIVTRIHPELVPDEEIYKMIMSMPYAQYSEDITCRTEYLTSDEVYNTQFSNRLPAVLPNGYHIAGLSRYTYDQYPSGGGSISLYLSNGVEDPNLSNYCPIRYTVQAYPQDPDTSDKPMYQSIWDLTLDDVKAAMESGGFYTTYMGIDLIEVSFPYADRVSAEDIYVMVKSAPCAVEPDAMTTVEHTLVYLSREELYNCQWHMFLPRYFPEGFVFDGYASYTPTGFMDDGVMTYRLTDKESGDQLEVTFTCDFEHGSVADAEIKLKELAVSDISKVKNGALIDCGNGGSTLQVSSPEKLNDEELYRMLTSIPASDNFAASGIETVDLSEYIGADIPSVAFDQFYDVKRVEIRTKFNDRDTFLPFFDVEFKSVDGFDGDFGSIVGYDGKNVYFENAGYVDDRDDSGRNITLFVRMIGMYDTENDSYRQLVRYYESDLEFIYADGEFIYYIVRETEGDEILRSTFYKRNMNDPIFGTVTDGSLLTVDGNISSPAVNGSYIYFAVDSEGQYGIVRFDMNEDVDAAIDANRSFVSMAVVPTAVEAVMPYRDGAVYNLQNDTKRFYYWNGEEVGETVFLFKAETDADVYSGDVYSDGEIFYKVTEGQLFNGTDYDHKQFFDALDIMGLSVTDRVNLAYNNGVDGNPWYTFSGAGNMANADGMIVPASYTGLIYDAQNGWFTHVDPNKKYWARPCAGDWLLMFEGDEEYGLSITGDVYDDYLTLCIITRK